MALLLATLLWDLIHLKIPNIDQLGRGQYLENDYNQSNEILRYLNFILLPFFTFLSLMIYFKKISIKNFFLQFQYTNQSSLQINKFNYVIKIILLFFLIMEFLSLDFIPRELDLLHDGQKLTAAYKSYTTDSLWSGSFLIIGLFVEIINTRLVWELFDYESIGLMRISIISYVLLCKLTLVSIAYKISFVSNFKENYKTLFFVTLSLIFISLIDYDKGRFGYKNIIFRELPILIFTYVFIDYLIDRSKLSKLILFLSPLSVFSVMLSLDRGIIFNILIIFFFVFLLINRKFKHLLIFLFSILICWLATYIYLADEFLFFIKNSFYIITEMNYVHGWIHPTPFSSQPGASRATKTLIFILLNLIISFYLFSKNEEIFSNNSKIILLFFAILSFLSYVYVLGRTEVHHIRESFGFPIIFTSIFIFSLVIKLLSGMKFASIKDIYFRLITLMFVILLPISIIHSNFNKVIDFKSRIISYIYLNDEEFLKSDDINFINNVKPIISKYDCFQNFTNDVALNYLLRKNNCSIFHMVFALSSKKTQNQLIESLKDTEIVISYTDRIRDANYKDEPNYKLWIVNNYIKKNYEIIFQQGDRVVLKKIE